MQTIKIKLNTNLQGYKKGDIISVPARDGKISDTYWHRRLIDAAIDNCIELVTPEKTPVKKPIKKVKESKDDV